MIMDDRLSQDVKQRLGTADMPDAVDISILFRLIQSLNAPIPKDVSPVGNSKDVKESQPWKQYSPMDVRGSVSKSNCIRSAQPSKTLSPMETSPAGNLKATLLLST